MYRLLPLISLALISTSFAQNQNWEVRGVGGGGSLFQPTISPHDVNEIFMHCDMTEVFHTTTGGLEWEALHFQQLLSTGGRHTTEYTSDPNILYGVHFDFRPGDYIPMKSLDGGVTWNALSSDPTGGGCWFIAADQASTDRVIVASYTQMYYSSDGGNNFQSVYSNSGGFYISDVFWDGNDIYVGTELGLLMSTDGGNSFALDATSGIPSSHGFLSFCGAKSGTTVRLMGTIAHQADLYPGVNALDVGVYVDLLTLDYGQPSWTSATSGISGNHNLFHIGCSFSDIDNYYVGGTDPSTSYPVVYHTSNGGGTWTEIFNGVNNQNITTGWSGYQGDEDWWYGEIVFGLGVAPTDPNVVIITDFGFAHITTDGGNSWHQAYVDPADENAMGSSTPQDQHYHSVGLENTSSWHVYWLDNQKMFASYTDITGIRSLDGGDSWGFDYSGNTYNTTYHVVEHPTNGTLYAAVSTVHDMYQSTYLTDSQIDNGNGAILYSTDDGVTWQTLHNFSMPVIWLAIDPNNADVMYASVINSSNGGIFKTSDLSNGASSNWSITATPTRTEGHPYNVLVLDDGTVVTTWSGRRAPGFTASSGVFISTDGGASWIDRSANDDMYYWTKDITIDPHDANQDTWYVSVHSGWGGAANNKGGLYKSTDRGQNWTKILTAFRVESATINPLNQDEMYVTTEDEGLLYTNDLNTGSNFNTVSGYPFLHPMRVFYHPSDTSEIWITSFGNGMRTSVPDSTNGIHSPTLALSDDMIKLYPNPANSSLFVSNGSIMHQLYAHILDAQGRIVKRLNLGAGTNLVNIGDLSSGLYMMQLMSEDQVVVKQFVKR